MAAGWRGTTEGFVFVWRDPALRSVAVLSCAIVAAYLPFESVIFPVYFEAQGEPERLGLIVTAMSAGGIVGALAHARVVDLVGRRAVFVEQRSHRGRHPIGRAFSRFESDQQSR